MILADLGASVLRVERRAASGLGIQRPLRFDLMRRGRPAITLDLKSESGVACLIELANNADALIEGFRPGVMERLGIGPDILCSENERLVFGRMTGWGQDGPLAQASGHDLNYIALTGALHMIGRKDQPPAPPLTFLGDFGGGALYLAMGVLSALLESSRSGKGQVVDAAIIDGVASLMVPFQGLLAAGVMQPERGTNVLDSGAFFYDCYRCKDDKWISVAPIEPKFFAELLSKLGLDTGDVPEQADSPSWAAGKDVLEKIFASRTREQWCAMLEGSDACFAPVLEPSEVATHPHCAARDMFAEVDGVLQARPAPRFSRTKPDMPSAPSKPDDCSDHALVHWLSPDRISALKREGVLCVQ